MNSPLARIAASGKEMLSPADVAPVLGCHPYAINVAAKTDPDRLGFPVCMIGNRVKIPRRAFLRWAGYEEETPCAHEPDKSASGPRCR